MRGRNFQVIHLRNPSFSSNGTESFDMLGIYPSLATAQRIAIRALEYALDGCRRRGYRGRYADEIDLQLRGLITVLVEDSQDEIPLSEFHIHEVYLEPNREERDNRSHLITRSTIQPPCFDEQEILRIVIAEHCWVSENRPEWSQTRTPWPSRRDDGPFRTQYHSTYENTFALANNTILRDGVTDAREEEVRFRVSG